LTRRSGIKEGGIEHMEINKVERNCQMAKGVIKFQREGVFETNKGTPVKVLGHSYIGTLIKTLRAQIAWRNS
jgi:hypothetical protein